MSYKVIVLNANDTSQEHFFENKPSFEDIYSLIDCSTIELTKGYEPSISNRSFDMYIDEEGKLKDKTPNLRATNYWFAWQNRTERTSLAGDVLVGDVAIVRKVA
jgi:hypothetical protein|tara:strand:- start:15 stop:326 length:312 start_codon:yes stop_codon:yes gene_type:complete